MELTKKESLIKELLAKKFQGGNACTAPDGSDVICDGGTGCSMHCVTCNCCTEGCTQNDDWWDGWMS